jgi:Fic-DOC domain mobile mystery protein B
MKIEQPAGATPMDDLSGLIPAHITTQQQLNEWEAENILHAYKKYFGRMRRFKPDAAFFRKIHKEMFGETWDWAGEFRKVNMNIGVDWQQIPVQLRNLCDDVKYWIQACPFDILEQSVRLHHRLVTIHPFVNGNGRHARFMADLFLYFHKKPMPQWPSEELLLSTDLRKHYIEALKAADSDNYKSLIDFTKALIKL